MSSKKIRADQLLVQKGLVESREQAKRLIMAGQVYILPEGQHKELINKPGQLVQLGTQLFLKNRERFVSRGGFKLLTALKHFPIDVQGKVVLDIGASTGGFTDCLLQMGVEKVYAVDVGYGLLHWQLRQDERVITIERVNMRYAVSDLLPEKVDLITIDCSFISLTYIIPPSLVFLKPFGDILALVKPQFELDRGETRKGLVLSQEKQLKAVEKIKKFVQDSGLLEYKGVIPSEITGPKGNQEYIIWMVKTGE